MDPTVLNMGNTPELNAAFATAMKPIYEKYAGNLDVASIYVEALMNLNPWQLWEKNTTTGEITPIDDNTLLLIKVIEDAFESSEEAKVHPALVPLSQTWDWPNVMMHWRAIMTHHQKARQVATTFRPRILL